MTHFSELGLADPIQKTLAELGYETPTPIQVQAIPTVLEGRDLLGIAQTGTGKTAAFTLPLLHHLNASQEEGQRPSKSVRSLILAPTRELAGQIAESVRDYGKLLGLRVNVVVGGVPIARQIKQLSKGTDVLIATPGRLEDLKQQKAVRLDMVTHLILDEADQMLDMGFIHTLKRIASYLPRERQTLLFSATMPKEIEALAANFLRDPAKVSVAPAATTAERVVQTAHFVKQRDKNILLARLLKSRDVSRAIVFCRTKHGANRLVEQLDKQDLDSVAIHGNKTQAQRQKALNLFRDGKCAILVATDVAARGIDIPEVSHVYNFELPEVPEQYVHRIGRTARAGREGIAVSLIADGERSHLKQIERLTKIKLEVLPLPEGFTEDLANRPEEVKSERPYRDPRARRDGGGGRGDRSRSGGENRNRGERSDRPRRDFDERPRGDRPQRFAEAGETRTRDDRPSGPRRENDDRPRGDRPQRSRDDREFRSRDDRPQRSRDDRDNRSRGDGEQRKSRPPGQRDGNRPQGGGRGGSFESRGSRGGKPQNRSGGGKPRSGGGGGEARPTRRRERV